MRSYLFILSIFAIVACSDDDKYVVSQNSSDDIINLNISTSNIDSKASLVNTHADMSDLALYCELHTDSSTWSDQTQYSRATNKKVIYDSANDAWVYDGEALLWGWESIDDKYSFRSYSPYADNNGIEPNIVGGELELGFTVDSDIENQIDLMMATPITDMYRGLGDQITLNFNHTLSALSFELVGEYDEVNSITIKNIYQKGVVVYNRSTEQIEWDVDSGEQTDFIITRAQIESGEYILVIPQEITEESVKFVVDLIDDDDVELTTSLTLDANYKYTFTIYIGSDISFGGIQIEAWEDASTAVGGSGGGSTSVYIATPRPVNFTANSYMIHPSDNFDTYYIDVNSQINYFWDNSNGYVTQDFSEYLIDEDDIAAIAAGESDLSATILWNKTGNTAIYPSLTTTGYVIKESVNALSAPDFTTSNCTVALKLEIGGGTSKPEGNFVVAVKRGDDILWSWHFWVTDYNPDLIASENSPEDGKYEYTYSGSDGALHRYKDGADAPEALWGDGGAYENKFIMDRNLGALSTGTGTQDATLLYQFGRKDPFPFSFTGSIGSSFYFEDLSVNGAAEEDIRNFSDAVLAPSTFYIYSASEDRNDSYATNWCKQYIGDEYLWNDYYILAEDYNNKSLFDPSPMGWQMISSNTCTDFEAASTFIYTSSTGCYYTPNDGTTKISYPLTGVFAFTYSGINDTTTWTFTNQGYIRCSKPSGVGDSYYMAYNINNAAASLINLPMEDGAWSRSHGIATRVIQHFTE